jgi:DNA-binding CsgD family transcriptional regulator
VLVLDIVRADNRGVAMLDDRQRFVRLLHRGLDLGSFFDSADRTLAGLVPFDRSCWLSLDPSTNLPTSHFARELDTGHLMQLAANEFLEDDVNKFAVLAGAPRPAGILSQATGGDLHLSARFTQVLAPLGHEHGDELRAVFLDGESAWGCVALHRREERFQDHEAQRVVAVGRYIAEGIRRALLTTAMTTDDANPPGLILVRHDDSIESMTPTARSWLAELYDTTNGFAALPLTLASIVDHARGSGTDRAEQVATVRIPTKTRGWLLAHALLFDDEPQGRVGIVLAPAQEPQIAPLIVEAYGLSSRERDVTRLVLRGRSTREIAHRLHVSAYTVQDHLKSIFQKVGVRSRRELVAELFLRHYAPRLEAGAKVSSNGWSAHEPPVNFSQ